MKTYRVTIWFIHDFDYSRMERHIVQSEAESIFDFLLSINGQWCLKPGDNVEIGPVSEVKC